MKISPQEVKELAELCKLTFEEKELTIIAEKINKILIDAEKIMPLAKIEQRTIEQGEAVFRDDDITPSLSHHDVFKNTSNKQDSVYFKVPRLKG